MVDDKNGDGQNFDDENHQGSHNDNHDQDNQDLEDIFSQQPRHEDEREDEQAPEAGDDIQMYERKSILSKLMSVLLISIPVLFIIIAFIFVYMKYSGNCAVLGKRVEKYIGSYICRDLSAYNKAKKVNKNKVSDKIEQKDVSDPFANTDSDIENDSELESDIKPIDIDEAPALDSSDEISETETDSEMVTDDTDSSEQELTEGADGTGDEALAPPKPIYETPALLVAENRQKITNKLPARVQSLGVRDGQSFKAGDILATLDCKDIELDLGIQKEILKDKKASFENLSTLKELNSTSVYSVIKAEAEYGQSKKIIEKLENQLKECVIIAEYDGKVITTSVTEKEFLFAGKEIMVINNNKDLLVKAYVPILWLQWLNVGTSFNLCIHRDCYTGVVTRIGAEVDAISQTLDVFGKLNENDSANLIAGLSGQIKFNKSE